MPIWEYMELEVLNWPKANDDFTQVDGSKATVGRKKMLEALNRLGGKGWESCSFETYQNAGVKSVYLKRAKG